MKSIRILFVVLMVFCVTVFRGYSQHEAPVRVMSVPYATSMVMDGVADEASYSSQISDFELFNNSGVTGDADFSGYIQVCYDYDNLYLFASITDDTEVSYEGTGDDYTFDNVEVFLDLDTTITNADGSYIGDEIQLRYRRGNYNDTISGSTLRNNADMSNYAIVSGATSWQLEAAIPWVCFMPDGSVPEDFMNWITKALGFDVQFADNDGSGRDGQSMWDADVVGAGATEDNAWKDTRVFGIIELLPGSDTPRADAGDDQTVDEGSLVTLDGSGSIDYQGDSLSFIWKTAQGITLSNPNAVSPTFTAPLISSDTLYTFVLNVSDGTNLSAPDSVTINVKNINLKPIAIAGSDTTINELDTLMLDGSASYDPEGSLLNYFWMPPNGIILDDPTSATPKFVAPELEADITYNFRLMVSDGYLNSNTDTVQVTVKQVNKIPVADAGPNHVIAPNDVVILDGSKSYDNDGQALTYSWSALDGGDISPTNSWMAVFTAPDIKEDKSFRFKLVVNDGESDSEADTAVVIVDYEPSGLNATPDNEITLTPNPAKEFIKIDFSGMNYSSSGYTLKMLSVNGSIVSEEKITYPVYIFNINNNIVSGVYIIRIYDNNNKIVVNRKIVIDK